jgi:hypothetical protein
MADGGGCLGDVDGRKVEKSLEKSRTCVGDYPALSPTPTVH